MTNIIVYKCNANVTSQQYVKKFRVQQQYSSLIPTMFLDFALQFQNGRSTLGDVIYRYITSDQFSAECLLDCLDLSSEHVALEIANRVEASVYVWRRRSHSKPPTHPNRTTAKSSWGMVKELMVDGDKRELLADRAESLLLCLKQRFPGLTQTALDTSKIQCNKVRHILP